MSRSDPAGMDPVSLPSSDDPDALEIREEVLESARRVAGEFGQLAGSEWLLFEEIQHELCERPHRAISEWPALNKRASRSESGSSILGQRPDLSSVPRTHAIVCEIVTRAGISKASTSRRSEPVPLT